MNATKDLLTSVFVVAILLVNQAEADFAFGPPVNLRPNVNASSYDFGLIISADGCTIYFTSNRPGGYGSWDVYVATRKSTDEEWGPAVNLGPAVNTPSVESPWSISADGLSLYLTSDRPGGYGDVDLWVTTRATTSAPWGTPVNLGPTVNSSSGEANPRISADGLELYFNSNRSGGCGSSDLWVATRATLSDPWGPPVNLDPTVDSANADYAPSISSDGLVLFFASGPASGSGPDAIWMTRRATKADPWGTPVKLGSPVNTSYDDGYPTISADGPTLYFTSNRPGGYGSYDLWQAPIIPIVDFNGDGKVDLQDLLRLIESWGKDDPSVDIGPMPWGDGKVDEKDLEVFMSYWGQEVTDPTLIACWKLDEASGMIAADSAGTNNGTLVGNPTWQPASGKVKGALQFDGVGACVRTPFVCDPSQGAFSVFAWVKGGGPGQVIVSQVNGANWLMAGA